MAAITFTVPGMRSRQGVRAVTALLRDLPGVETVQADASTAILIVDGDVSEQQVRRVLAAVGFPAAPGAGLSS